MLSVRCTVAGLLAVAAVGGLSGPAPGQTPGNLIVTVNEFTGSSSAPIRVSEYTPAGAFVQDFAGLPIGGGTERVVRDLTVGADGGLYVYNGTFTPTLSRRDPGTGNWTGQTFAGWSTFNNVTYGGLAADGRYVYATDMNTSGAAAQGVVRFDTQGGATVRFATASDSIDLTVGRDGFVYTLDGSDTVRRFNRATLAQVGADLVLPFNSSGYRAIAVDADGSILAARFSNIVDRVSAAGAIVDTLTVPGVSRFSDVDINPLTGQVALASAFDSKLVVTDPLLTTATVTQLSASTQGGDAFVTWNVSPVPEPAALLAACAAAVWLVRRRTAESRGRPTVPAPRA